MADDALCFESISILARRIRNREISPVEVVALYLDRITRLNEALGAYLTVLPERAMAEARRAEQEVMAGRPLGPLHGVPVAVKDLLDTADVNTTHGSPIYADHKPERSSTAVARLEDAGAILLGKLHLTEFAFMAHHPDLPVARNPWSLDRSPGGSSSGSAIAAAAGLCAGALGSDTVASIRLPAAWCGAVGFKPTWGRVSRAGGHAMAPSLDHVGPMTRTVGDAALMVDCIAGPDPLDPTTRRGPLYPAGFVDRVDWSGVRVGWDETFNQGDVQADVAAAIDSARRTAASLGATIVPIEIPDQSEALESFAKIFSSEMYHAHRATFPKQAHLYSRPLRRSLEAYGRMSPSEHIEGTLGARAFGHRIATMFEEIDVLLCPNAPIVAAPLSPTEPHVAWAPGGDQGPFYPMRFTCLWNLAGTPALALPWGLNEQGLPLSIQLIGPADADGDLLSLAACLESHAPVMGTPSAAK